MDIYKLQTTITMNLKPKKTMHVQNSLQKHQRVRKGWNQQHNFCIMCAKFHFNGIIRIRKEETKEKQIMHRINI